jgi:hypothetical protein
MSGNTPEKSAELSESIDRVMVDIETLGLETGSAILSIGAVEFAKGGLGREFYEEISLSSCQEAGLEVDADTLEWWLDQDESVRGVLTGGRHLADVVIEFHTWFPEGAEVWANSPSFDCEQLEAAFHAVGSSEPWEFRDERCVRTTQSLPCAVEVETDGDEHHALHDAKRQARSVSRTLSKIDRNERGENDAE